jgi:hypothetical protein
MSLNTTELGLLYSYNLRVSDYGSIRMGTQMTYATRSGNLENLIYGDQIDVFSRSINPNSIDYLDQLEQFGYFDLGFGLMYGTPNFWLGMSAYHVNNPKMMKACIDGVQELYEKGVLKPQVGAEFKSTELAEAHAFLESGKSVGKVAVRFSS